MKRKRLPIGNSDFKEIIEEGFYYVDKSLLIQELLDNGSKITLITRPRRFGKTLNIMMLKYWFEKYGDDEGTGVRVQGLGSELKPNSQQPTANTQYQIPNTQPTTPNTHLFQHLKIWQLGDDYTRHCGKYPVIFLTFKDIKENNWNDCEYQLKKTISREYERHEYLLESKFLSESQKKDFLSIKDLTANTLDYKHSLKNLTKFLQQHYKEKVVVLIDEYDTPVHEAFAGKYYENVIDFLRPFLGAGLKDNVNLQLCVITGILRVSRENLFSDLNNINIFTILESGYADKFGILESEVAQMFHDFGIESDLEEAKKWYNGYVIGGTKDIYNPWSIINYVEHHRDGLKPYWVNTSSNKMIKDLMAKGDTFLKADLQKLVKGNTIEKKIEPHTVFADLERNNDSIWTLLLFAGYLKILKSRRDEWNKFWYELAIPNMEVAGVYEKFLEQFLTDYISTKEVEYFLNSLVTGDVDTFEAILQKYIKTSMSYFDKDGENPENIYHAFVLGLLVYLNGRYVVKSNSESGFGRYDISLIPLDKTKKGIILEFKVVNTRKKETLEKAVESALKQIEDKQYETELKAMGIIDIAKYGVAFEGKEVLVGMA